MGWSMMGPFEGKRRVLVVKIWKFSAEGFLLYAS